MNKFNEKDTLLICEKNTTSYFDSNKYIHIIFTKENGKSTNYRTFLNDYLDNNAILVRQTFLSKINKLGNKKVFNSSIIRNLIFDGEFSSWWLTLINEKSNFAKSPLIDKAVKLTALELLIKEYKFKKLILISEDKYIISSLSRFCKLNKKNFTHKNNFFKKIFFKVKSRKIYFVKIINIPLSLLVLLKYIFVNREFLKFDLSNWKNSKAYLTFISYLTPKSPNISLSNSYDTFWGPLPKKLREWNIPSNWLYIETSQSGFNKNNNSYAHLKAINKKFFKKENHFNILNFLNHRVLFLSIFSWISNVIRGISLIFFVNKNDKNIYFIWDIIFNIWIDSFLNKEFIIVILQHYLFSRALRLLPNQKIGFYLQENINWQNSLITNWKKYNHNDLIGVNHSTLRFWDLRNFNNVNYILKNESNVEIHPYPNFTAVNSLYGRQILLEGGISKNKIIELEALRFFPSKEKNRSILKKIYFDKNKKNLIIFGAFNYLENKFQINLLNKIYGYLDDKFNIFYKSHPSGSKYNQIKFRYNNCSVIKVDKLLEIADIVYTSSMTSTAVEAYEKNIPIIITYNPENLNLSPLYKFKNVDFVTSEKEMLVFLQKVFKEDFTSKIKREYFILDSNLNRWKSLLWNKLK